MEIKIKIGEIIAEIDTKIEEIKAERMAVITTVREK